MIYTFIVNPRAGGGMIASRRRNIRRAICESGLVHRVLVTERPRHAVQFAKEAAADSDVLVAVGGDGTIHEVVSGIVESGVRVPLGIIPGGSGNDFAKMFDVPHRPGDAVAVLKDATPRHIDYGLVEWEGPAGTGSAVFVNAAGTGIDAKVAEAAAGFKLLTGTPRYVLAVLRTLRGWTAPQARVEISRADQMIAETSDEVLTVLVGNGRCAAGGFYLTPDARIDDGLLDACVIRNASIPRILALIPRVIRNGRHVGEPEVTLEKADKVAVYPSRALAVQADGEVISTAATRVSFTVVPDGLSVVLPVKS